MPSESEEWGLLEEMFLDVYKKDIGLVAEEYYDSREGGGWTIPPELRNLVHRAGVLVKSICLTDLIKSTPVRVNTIMVDSLDPIWRWMLIVHDFDPQSCTDDNSAGLLRIRNSALTSYKLAGRCREVAKQRELANPPEYPIYDETPAGTKAGDSKPIDAETTYEIFHRKIKVRLERREVEWEEKKSVIVGKHVGVVKELLEKGGRVTHAEMKAVFEGDYDKSFNSAKNRLNINLKKVKLEIKSVRNMGWNLCEL